MHRLNMRIDTLARERLQKMPQKDCRRLALLSLPTGEIARPQRKRGRLYEKRKILRKTGVFLSTQVRDASVFRRRALLTPPSLRSRPKNRIETWQERAGSLQLGVQVLKMLHRRTVQRRIITFGVIWKKGHMGCAAPQAVWHKFACLVCCPTPGP